MKEIVVLSSSPNGRIVSRFKEEFTQRNVPVKIFDFEIANIAKFNINQVVLVRIAPEQNNKWLVIFKKVTQSGAVLINPIEATVDSRDKYSTYQKFIRFHVPTPDTILYIGQSFDDVAGRIGQPFLLKHRYGTGGEGIFAIHQSEQLAGQFLGNEYIAQRFIIESKGVDYRVIVVGGKIIAAMKKIAVRGNFRSNIHQGAHAHSHLPDLNMKKIAIRAANALALDIAGVDIVETKNGLVVLEANASPGLQIERITKVNVAGAICDYIIDLYL